MEIHSNVQVGQGKVKKSSGHEILDPSTLDAVREWKCMPVKKGEKAIARWMNIPVKFQLQ
jgi:protein TonB